MLMIFFHYKLIAGLFLHAISFTYNCCLIYFIRSIQETIMNKITMSLILAAGIAFSVPVSASLIGVENAGFEVSVLGNGGFSDTVPGWSFYDSNSVSGFYDGVGAYNPPGYAFPAEAPEVTMLAKCIQMGHL